MNPSADNDTMVAVTLAECPIGLFMVDGELCLKTEYGNNEGRIDAYIVSSGEFFWGDHPQTIPNQRMQMVVPVDGDALAAALLARHQSETGAALTSDGRESFEAEHDNDTFTIRFPDGHAITAWADGRLIVTKTDPGFAPFVVNVAALAQPTSDGREVLVEALAEAYRKGATDVHNYWTDNPGEPPQGDPEFGEAASDYAMSALDLFDSSARAALAQPVEAGEDGA